MILGEAIVKYRTTKLNTWQKIDHQLDPGIHIININDSILQKQLRNIQSWDPNQTEQETLQITKKSESVKGYLMKIGDRLRLTGVATCPVQQFHGLLDVTERLYRTINEENFTGEHPEKGKTTNIAHKDKSGNYSSGCTVPAVSSGCQSGTETNCPCSDCPACFVKSSTCQVCKS